MCKLSTLCTFPLCKTPRQTKNAPPAIHQDASGALLYLVEIPCQFRCNKACDHCRNDCPPEFVSKYSGGFFQRGQAVVLLLVLCRHNFKAPVCGFELLDGQLDIGVQPVKSSRKPHKGNSSLVDVQGGPNKDNPNLFPIGDGFGLFVFFGKLAFAKQ